MIKRWYINPSLIRFIEQVIPEVLVGLIPCVADLDDLVCACLLEFEEDINKTCWFVMCCLMMVGMMMVDGRERAEVAVTQARPAFPPEEQ